MFATAWLMVPSLLFLILGIGIVLLWKPIRNIVREIQEERARESFQLQRERLEAKFFDLVANSGTPRGLLWKDCDWDNAVTFAWHRQNGHIVALISITVSFEAVAGIEMEEVEAVSEPLRDSIYRNGTAIFHFIRGNWQPFAKVYFNMNPNETIQHYASYYELVQHKELNTQ